MAMTFSPIPLTGVPFAKSEYERRQQKVLEAVVSAELDALLVTAHANLQYLTGYNGRGAYFAPFPLILMPGRAPTYVVREYEMAAVRADSCIDQIVPYAQQGDFAKVCADVLKRYGLQRRRVGLELGCWNLAPADVSALQAQLTDLQIVDATRVVSLVKAVKSGAELDAMRGAMAMTDLAVQTFQHSLREGVTEAEVAALIEREVTKAGGQISTVSSLGFGERTRLPHGVPAPHPIRINEPAMVEIGCSKHGYATGLVRSAVIGRHPETESLHALAEDALEAAIAAIKPGVAAGAVDAAARKMIERCGRPQAFRHRTGYATGPQWSGRGNLSLEPGATDVLQAGMTLHLPILLFGQSDYIIGCSEHVVVTERGAEILSRTPHTLYRA
ncbi:Xaa-Pro peptidase family protein [Bradyrhizobium brasilense]|uniref:M24 family metallopeptidase n=1 Tax=Bradyrhizobium brasilense TaxID=1419277 RepID=UPI0024B06FDC|nr:Xaa-Pro peptidase family protein [Bradyrhizobium australafricanum]WFU31384.1 Xaa-Pro peptidase family protein [Bradyrhizobium australafricanum]